MVLEHSGSDSLGHMNTNTMEAIKANGKVNKSMKDDINDLYQILKKKKSCFKIRINHSHTKKSLD